MKNLAYAILDGNLTADPETKLLNSGKTVSTFSVAVNHYGGKDKSENDVSFIEIETWDKLAENCGEYLKKGRPVTVMGNIKQERWKSTDGTLRQRFKIVANTVRFDKSFEKNNANKQNENYAERPTERKKAA
ncbi:MAG: single-stranded DNA-binding protein [Leptospiraceae bacterium]|nr:single-stranded DNA-binding protein [Leptospiraceae bacterium]